MSSKLIAGVDEVGRGPLAGPVVTAAVILPEDHNIQGLNDSKKLSKSKRETLSSQIKESALAWSIGQCSVEEIDRINILNATMLAMQKAVSGLSMMPHLVLVDGNRTPDFGIKSEAIVKGDGKVECISAASIIAKVFRDELMAQLSVQYPQYGFEQNAGYPTKRHREALLKYGASPVHRKSYAPVQATLAFEE